MLIRTQRVVKEKDFNAVLGRGRFVTTPFFLLKYIRNDRGSNRYGFIVSKKVSKKATERNKVKRRLRAIIQKTTKEAQRGCDMVFVVKKGATTASFGELQEATLGALKKTL